MEGVPENYEMKTKLVLRKENENKSSFGYDEFIQ